MNPNANSFDAATAHMTADQRHNFEQYFLGALSVNVHPELWADALRSARRCYANYDSSIPESA